MCTYSRDSGHIFGFAGGTCVGSTHRRTAPATTTTPWVSITALMEKESLRRATRALVVESCCGGFELWSKCSTPRLPRRLAILVPFVRSLLLQKLTTACYGPAQQHFKPHACTPPVHPPVDTVGTGLVHFCGKRVQCCCTCAWELLCRRRPFSQKKRNQRKKIFLLKKLATILSHCV